MFKQFFQRLLGAGNSLDLIANNPDIPQHARAQLLAAQTGSPMGNPRDAAVREFLAGNGGRI